MKKKAFLIALAALALSRHSRAQSVNLDLTFTASPLGQASQSAAVIYGLDSTLTYTTNTLRQVQVDANGNLKTSGSGGNVSITSGTVTANQGAAGTAAWPVNLTNTVTIDPKGTSVVAFLASSYVYKTSTALSVGTAGLAVNVSGRAGVSCNDCRVYWSTRDAVGVYWDYANSATIPAVLGHFAAASVTATLDDGFVDGQWIIFAAPAGTINVFLTEKSRQ